MIKLFQRRTSAPSTTETDATPQQNSATEWHRKGVSMQFLTQGGTPVDLYELTWTAKEYRTVGGEPTLRPARGYNWECSGCDTVGRDIYAGGYEESRPEVSKREANVHARECHAMPKPWKR